MHRAILVLLLIPFLAGCAISREREVALGQQLAPEVEQQLGGLVQDPQLQAYVDDVGSELAALSSRPDLPWEFGVLADDSINALALPGGKIYITQGMLRNLDNEAQLAAILAHEVAHVEERHSVDQMKQSQLLQGGVLLTDVLTEGSAPASIAATAGQFLSLGYSRGQEQQADIVGLDLLSAAGYQPQAMVEVMQMLDRQAQQGPPEFLSTHPAPENRVEYLREAIDETYGGGVLTAGRPERGRFRQIVGP